MKSRVESSTQWLTSGLSESGKKQIPRKLVIENRPGLLRIDYSEIWEYRDLLSAFVVRELKVRYKQTAIGISWVLLQPLVSMLIFTAIFGYLAKMPSDGVWYPVFALSALIPWTYFAQSVTRAGDSLVSNANLVTKIYFPRILLPAAAIVSHLVDLALSLLVLFGLLMYAGIPLTAKLLALPLFIAFAMLTALALSLFVAATNVRYRDVSHAMPFVIQIWMFASPIVYPASLVPEKWRLLYALNPMVGVIEGFRWALLGHAAPDVFMIGVSALMVCVLLALGIVYFHHMQRQFADVI